MRQPASTPTHLGIATAAHNSHAAIQRDADDDADHDRAGWPGSIALPCWRGDTGPPTTGRSWRAGRAVSGIY